MRSAWVTLRIFVPLCFFASVWFCAAVRGDSPALEPDRPVPEFTLARGESRTFRFRTPSIPPGQVLAVDFSARATGDGLLPGEGRYYLDLRWNGAPLPALQHRLRPLLRNKPLTEQGQAWYLQEIGWRIKHADRFAQPPDDSLRYVVELDSPSLDRENLLTFTNMPQHDVVPKLSFQGVTLRLLPAQPSRKGYRVEDEAPPVISFDARGGIFVQSGAATIPVTTSLSKSGGGWWQVGTPSDSLKPAEPMTMKSLDVSNPDKVTLFGESKSCRWVRQFMRQGNRIIGKEELTNLTDEEQGMMWRQEFLFPAPLESVSLAGDDDPSVLQTRLPANPSVFTSLGSFGVGMIAEDDVLRTQAIEAYDPATGRLSLRTERLLVPPKETVTLRWSLYALPGADYYDFINQVRRDWKVGFPLAGAYWWDAQNGISASDDDLTTWLEAHRPAAAVIGSWVDYRQKKPRTVGLGPGVLSEEFADYRQRLAKYIERLHRLQPDLKVLVYEHPFYNWPEKQAGEFRESWIVKADGERFFLPANSNDTQAAGVFPSVGSEYGEAFRRTLVELRKQLKVDGFYLDETTHPGRLADPLTYGTSDNVTAILDPRTFAIRAKVGNLPLLSRGYLEELVEQLREADLLVLGNFAPATERQNRETWPRFVETDNLKGCAAAHLYSPLAFSYSFERYTIQQVRDRLMHGLLWCVTGPKDRLGLTDHFFPITPVGLHAGSVWGKERIVTAVSGEFGWGEAEVGVRQWRYDSQGKLLDPEPDWQLFRGKQQIDIPPGGIVVLERR
ncbi:MAG: hypothetical protein U0903_00405 [Planctomycetales bacterium]